MLIETLVTIFYGYAGLGAIFGIYFVIWGAARIDVDAHHLPILVRLLLWPASVALWPFMLAKVVRNRPDYDLSIPADAHSAEPKTP